MSFWARCRLVGGAAAIRAVGLPAWSLRRYGWLPTVLTYHGVHDGSLLPEHSRYSTKHVDVRDLRRQLMWLKRRYDVVSLAEVEKAIRTGDRSRRRAAVTFDDGYENNFTVAWPVLKELGVPATLFVTVDVVENQRPYDHDRVELALRSTDRKNISLAANGRHKTYSLDSPQSRSRAIYDLKAWLSRLPHAEAHTLREQLLGQCWCDRFVTENRIAYQPLTWGQVGCLADEGMEIASHTLSHPHLAQAADDQIRVELAESRRRLEARIGKPVTRLSYPHGSFDARVARIAEQTGYTSAYTSNQWFAGESPGLFAVPRISVSSAASFGLFIVTTTRALMAVGRGNSTSNPAEA